MEGNSLKQKGISINLDKERHLIFDLNAFCELEDKYGDISKAMEVIKSGSMKAIRYMLYLALKNEDDDITEKQAGKLVTLENINEISNSLSKAMNISLPEANEKNMQTRGTGI